MIRLRQTHLALVTTSIITATIALWSCGGNNTGGQNNNAPGDGAVTCGDGGTVELCDGVDNNCDGVVDENCGCINGDTQDCYSGDPAEEGVGVCVGGTETCNLQGDWGDCEGEVLPSAEECDGEDNDCNGQVDEGLGSETCGDGICQVTVESCQNGQPVTCVPGTPNPMEACDGVDDDCDGTVDEDCDCIDDVTQPCYTGSLATQNVGECHDGTQICVLGEFDSCVGDSTPIGELCNGLDDDCDGTIDNGDPESGGACNTGLLGVCAAGIERCIGSTIVCVQTTAAASDLCDGLDNDCNPATPDGVHDPTIGVPCDGADADLCDGGVMLCTNGTAACSDDLTSNLDLCDGIDNDCNPLTPDGAHDPQVGQPCDGGDSDECAEGIYSCAAGGLSCSDNTSGTSELCAGDGLDEDCDGSVDEGFTRNDNPACSSGTFNMGTVSGDTGSDVLTDTWYNEEWNSFTITEDNNGIVYISATISLYSPPGVDYDLYVYCNNCSGGLAGSSLTGGLTGHFDTVQVRSDDDWLVGDDFTVIVEVRHFNSTQCAFWDLTVTGNT